MTQHDVTRRFPIAQRKATCVILTAIAGPMGWSSVGSTRGAQGLGDLRLVDRKQMLRDSFENTPELVYVVGIAGAGSWVFEQAELHDFERMAAERLDASYQCGRSRDWLKIRYADYSCPAALGFGRT